MAEDFVSNSGPDNGHVKCLLLYFKRGEECVCSQNDRRIASQSGGAARGYVSVAACRGVEIRRSRPCKLRSFLWLVIPHLGLRSRFCRCRA